MRWGIHGSTVDGAGVRGARVRLVPPRERLRRRLRTAANLLLVAWSLWLCWTLLRDTYTVRGFVVWLGGIMVGSWLVRGSAPRGRLDCAWCRRPATHLLRRNAPNSVGRWPWWPACRADGERLAREDSLVGLVEVRSLV